MSPAGQESTSGRGLLTKILSIGGRHDQQRQVCDPAAPGWNRIRGVVSCGGIENTYREHIRSSVVFDAESAHQHERNLQRSRRSDADNPSRGPCFVLSPVSAAAMGIVLCWASWFTLRPGNGSPTRRRDAPTATRSALAQVLVGHQACLGHGGGHTTWTCRTCDQTVYGPPLNTHCTALEGLRRCGSRLAETR